MQLYGVDFLLKMVRNHADCTVGELGMRIESSAKEIPSAISETKHF